MGPITAEGTLGSGARYRYEVPADWNGVLLLYSRPVPVAPGDPPWQDRDASVSTLVGSGFAVAGVANTIFWPLEASFADLPALAQIFAEHAGSPSQTIGFGQSIGGIITAGLVQRVPGLLSGALPMCGNLAGSVAVHNRELDIAFVVKTLLADGTPLQLVRIEDPAANLGAAERVLSEAGRTPRGRARLALAAAVGNIPGWYDPASDEPDAEAYREQLHNQIAWFKDPGFLVYFQARARVELQAGGNPSWNTDVDYSDLLLGSINAAQVSALYEEASVDLADDLGRLAGAARIEADPAAVSYLEEHIVFDGELREVPVLTMHTDGDGLVTPDNQHAYAEVVRWAGHEDQLRQVYVHRGGHCSFMMTELLTGLDVLLHRMDGGSWPDLSPSTLNARVAEHRAHIGATSPPGTGSGFFEYRPRPFTRPYDARMAPDQRHGRSADVRQPAS